MKNNKMKIFTVILITAIIMAISSITIYSNVCAPKFYDYFIDTGIKYLMDGKYEEAILAFNKAIEIEEKSTEARVYLAQGYVGNNEVDKAIEVLEEAQNLDMTNEELLKEILEILNKIDSDVAYEFLDRFINAVGKDNISDDIKDILDSATELPNTPVADPEPGTYIKPISVKLKLDKIKVGHSFYYTTDGSEPSKSSQKYRGKIDIDKSTTIKLIGYNKNGESTEIITLDYIIDTNIVNDIENTLKESKDLLNTTKVGTNVGDITKEAKKAFKLVIDKVSDLLKKDSLSYDDASSMKSEIENALKTFKENIIEPTDKSKLLRIIDEAQNLYDNSTEGSSVGEYKVGSKKLLLDSINEAKKVYNDILSQQKIIDAQVSKLKNKVKKFEESKNKGFTQEVALEKMLKYFGVNATKKTTAYGEVYYEAYKPEGEWAAEWYQFRIIEEQIVNNKRVYYSYISGSEVGSGRASDVGSYYIDEDGNVYDEYTGNLADRNRLSYLR